MLLYAFEKQIFFVIILTTSQWHWTRSGRVINPGPDDTSPTYRKNGHLRGRNSTLHPMECLQLPSWNCSHHYLQQARYWEHEDLPHHGHGGQDDEGDERRLRRTSSSSSGGGETQHGWAGAEGDASTTNMHPIHQATNNPRTNKWKWELDRSREIACLMLCFIPVTYQENDELQCIRRTDDDYSFTIGIIIQIITVIILLQTHAKIGQIWELVQPESKCYLLNT